MNITLLKLVIIVDKSFNSNETITYNPSTDEFKKSHTLLNCTGCGCYWGRDINSCLNILRIAIYHQLGPGRPKTMKRIKKQTNKH